MTAQEEKATSDLVSAMVIQDEQYQDVMEALKKSLQASRNLHNGLTITLKGIQKNSEEVGELVANDALNNAFEVSLDELSLRDKLSDGGEYVESNATNPEKKESLLKAIEEQQKRVKELQSQLAEQEQIQRDGQHKLQERQICVEALEKQVECLQVQIEDHKVKEEATKKQELEELEKTVNTMKKCDEKLAEKDERIAELEDQVDSLKDQADELEDCRNVLEEERQRVVKLTKKLMVVEGLAQLKANIAKTRFEAAAKTKENDCKERVNRVLVLYKENLEILREQKSLNRELFARYKASQTLKDSHATLPKESECINKNELSEETPSVHKKEEATLLNKVQDECDPQPAIIKVSKAEQQENINIEIKTKNWEGGNQSLQKQDSITKINKIMSPSSCGNEATDKIAAAVKAEIQHQHKATAVKRLLTK